MANIRISELPAADPITGPELVPATQTGQTVKVTMDEIKNFVADEIGGAFQPVDGDLTNIADITTTGILVRAASENWLTRTILGAEDRVTVGNGDGISGNISIDIHTNYVGQTSITTLGTITVGTWNGSIIPATFGGAGNINGILKANGTGLVTAAISGTDFVGTGSITTSGLSTNTTTLLGRTTATAGPIEELTVSDGLILTSGTLSASPLLDALDDKADFSIHTDSLSPTGFVNKNDSVYSFDIGTREFSIEPTSTEFYYYEAGQKYLVVAPQSVITSDVDGVHLIYFDGETLTAFANPTLSQRLEIGRTKTVVASLYWNATTNSVITLNDNRYEIQMDAMTRVYLSVTEGIRYISGLALIDLVTEGNGSSDTHAQFGIDDGVLLNNDIVLTPALVAATTGVPTIYREGANGIWVKDTLAGFSILTTGTGRPAYNQFSGGWLLTEVPNGNYVLYHLFATGDTTEPLVSIMGTGIYPDLTRARGAAETEINNIIADQSLPPDVRPIATVIYQSSNTYTNAVKARIRTFSSASPYRDWRADQLTQVVSSITNHNNLSNLQGGAVGEYFHLTTSEHNSITSRNNANELIIDTGVTNIDLAIGEYFTLELTESITDITFSNLPGAGKGASISIFIQQDGTGAHTVALPANFKAIDGSDVAVQSAANAISILKLTTFDNGTRWEYYMKAGAA